MGKCCTQDVLQLKLSLQHYNHANTIPEDDSVIHLFSGGDCMLTFMTVIFFLLLIALHLMYISKQPSFALPGFDLYTNENILHFLLRLASFIQYNFCEIFSVDV